MTCIVFECFCTKLKISKCYNNVIFKKNSNVFSTSKNGNNQQISNINYSTIVVLHSIHFFENLKKYRRILLDSRLAISCPAHSSKVGRPLYSSRVRRSMLAKLKNYNPLAKSAAILDNSIMRYINSNEDLSSEFLKLTSYLRSSLGFVKRGRRFLLKYIRSFFRDEDIFKRLRYINNVLFYLDFKEGILEEFILQMLVTRGISAKLLKLDKVNKSITAYIRGVLDRDSVVINNRTLTLVTYQEIYYFLELKTKFVEIFTNNIHVSVGNLIKGWSNFFYPEMLHILVGAYSKIWTLENVSNEQWLQISIKISKLYISNSFLNLNSVFNYVKGVSIEIKFMKKYLKMFPEKNINYIKFTNLWEFSNLSKLLFRKCALLQVEVSLMFLEKKKKFSTGCFYNASSNIIDWFTDIIHPENRVSFQIDNSDTLLLVFNFIAFYMRSETEVKKFVRFINSLDTNLSCEIVNQLMVEHLQGFISIIEYAGYIFDSLACFEGRNKHLNIDFRLINKIKGMLSEIMRLGKDIDKRRHRFKTNRSIFIDFKYLFFIKKHIKKQFSLDKDLLLEFIRFILLLYGTLPTTLELSLIDKYVNTAWKKLNKVCKFKREFDFWNTADHWLCKYKFMCLKAEHIVEDLNYLDASVEGLYYTWWEIIYKEALTLGSANSMHSNQEYTYNELSYIDWLLITIQIIQLNINSMQLNAQISMKYSKGVLEELLGEENNLSNDIMVRYKKQRQSLNSKVLEAFNRAKSIHRKLWVMKSSVIIIQASVQQKKDSLT